VLVVPVVAVAAVVTVVVKVVPVVVVVLAAAVVRTGCSGGVAPRAEGAGIVEAVTPMTTERTVGLANPDI
jgi:hypothetical protein